MKYHHCVNKSFILLGTILWFLSIDCEARASTLDWMRRSARSIDQRLTGAVYGGGTFVVVGWSGTVITSPDGIAWTKIDSGLASDMHLSAVTYANQLFIAVGGGGYNGRAILTSTNGIDWAKNISQTGIGFTAIAYGRERFVAVAGDQLFGGAIWASADGITWSRSAFSLYRFEAFFGIAYGNETFVAVGRKAARSFDKAVIFTSPDGTNWTERTTGTARGLNGVTFGNGRFVAVGNGGVVSTSSDGVVWTATSVPKKETRLNGVAYDHGLFIAVGDTAMIFTSVDGLVWNDRSPSTPLNHLHAVASGNGTFITVGIFGTILQTAFLSPPVLSITRDSFRRLPGILLRSYFGASYEIQASVNLVDWTPLQAITNSNSLEHVLDINVLTLPSRFYRAALVEVISAPQQPPVIVTHSVGGPKVVGSNVTLNVQAEGSPPLRFQWRLDGIELRGETREALFLNNIQSANAGTYTVTVSNSVGSITSPPIVVTITLQ